MTRARRCSEDDLLASMTDSALISAASSYAVTELQKDVERELALLPESEREAKRTKFAVFVVHNKLKPKLAEIPADIP